MSAIHEEKMDKLLAYPYDAFLMVRLEFVLILKDELEAKLLRIIEKHVEDARKTIYRETINTTGAPENGQVIEVTKDIWVPISYKVFRNDLFDMVTSDNTIKRALKHLETRKIIFRRHTQANRYDAPEYKIHSSVLQMLLNLLRRPGYQKLIPSILDTLKNLPPQELTPSECQALIPLAEKRVSEIDTTITKGITDNNGNNNREDSVGSGEPDAAPASDRLIDFAQRKAESDARLKVVRPSQDTPWSNAQVTADMTAADMRPAQGDGNDSTLHLTAVTPARVVAVPQQQGGAHGQLTPPSQQDNHLRAGTLVPPVPVEQAGVAEASAAASALPLPPPMQAASGGKRKPPKPVQPTLKTPDELAIDALCSRLYTALTSEAGGMRGYAWDTKGAIMNERTAIRRFVEKYYPAHNDGTFDLFQQIYTRLATKHFKWSKPSFVHRITAYVVFDEAQSELLQMKDEANGKKPGAPPPPRTDRPKRRNFSEEYAEELRGAS